MKLKESTFAIIAEKKDSISHKWFEENAGGSGWVFTGQHYVYSKGDYEIEKDRPKGIPIYTESEFEALLKAEEFSEICEASKLQPKNTAFGSENIAHKHLNENAPTTPKQITISYNLSLEYIAERLNVDKGIIKIEMP